MAKSKPINHKSLKPAPPVKTAKLGLLSDLLKRKTGATIDEAFKTTGWLAHAVLGAMSGALKKKRGPNIERTRVPVRQGSWIRPGEMS